MEDLGQGLDQELLQVGDSASGPAPSHPPTHHHCALCMPLLCMPKPVHNVLFVHTEAHYTLLLMILMVLRPNLCIMGP